MLNTLLNYRTIHVSKTSLKLEDIPDLSDLPDLGHDGFQKYIKHRLFALKKFIKNILEFAGHS